MKLEGTYKGMNVYYDPNIEPGILYVTNDKFQYQYPKRKDGKPDMRFSVNWMMAQFCVPYYWMTKS